MPLPVDLVLVRHGESELNVASKASRNGDNSLFTPEFRAQHSRSFRLTSRGVEQARVAGVWIRENFPQPFDRFYVSDYIRAKETAVQLALPWARWRVEFHLRERDKALADNLSADEINEHFALEQKQCHIDPFLAYPAGGGESIAMLCMRIKATILEHLARECSDKRVVIVCHGHVMRAFQIELEDLKHDDFIDLECEKARDLEKKIHNAQIIWYSRRSPATGNLSEPHFVAVRSVCPWMSGGDFGWRSLERKRFSDDDLKREVENYRRFIS